MRTKKYLLFSKNNLFAGNRGQHFTTQNVTDATTKIPGKMRKTSQTQSDKESF